MKEKKKIAVFWFRRDLRFNDNVGLYKALEQKYPVLPIFIFDPKILEELPRDDPRVFYIYQQIERLHKELQLQKKGIKLFHSSPSKAFKELLQDYDIQGVFTNTDYEPYAINRDLQIAKLLDENTIPFIGCKDQVIFEKNEICKVDGSPYRVYTPYSKKWIEKLTEHKIVTFPSENELSNIVTTTDDAFPRLSDLGFLTPSIEMPAVRLSDSLIDSYAKTRNFPAIDGTSLLGLSLRFGTVSIRETVLQAKKSSNNTFLKELIWREFFMQILWHFPETVTKAFKPIYDNIKWRDSKADFERWKTGTTGYPMVDAGMRQLNATGFMHNRVRMVVASFLCKHLLLDWRWGEAYFAEKLFDFDLSANVGNWQWVAGCGVDAAPYFRIFNPTEQIKKFDKELKYVQRWVPELNELHYPTPMVVHKEARQRCLEVYKKGLGK